MTPQQPQPWHCRECKASDYFFQSLDRLLHVSRGHIGRVVDADEAIVQVGRTKSDKKS